MKISKNHLKRYKEIALLLWKYGRSDLARQMNLDAGLEPHEMPTTTAPDAVQPEQLADDLEALGPTYVKLGQILSSRPDVLPEPYLKALERLQDRVKPFAFAEVEKIVHTELGVRLSKAFAEFNPQPIAAASLGQVHAAVLRSGKKVVVKVQRPEIRQQIVEDFEVLAEIAEFFDAHTAIGKRYRFLTILEEFRVTVQQELNYEHEAHNLIVLGENLREFPHIQVPQPVPDYTTRCVLTMDYVAGRKITSLSPLLRLDFKGAPLAEELFKAYLKQVLLDGVFHADPHPGNIFLTDDRQIALLDLGMVGHTTPAMQEYLFKLLIAVSEGQSDQAADLVLRMSQTTEDFQPAEFRRHLGQLMALHQDQNLQQINVGKSLLEVSRSAADSGLLVPGELTMLGKTLLQLDEVGRILDPDFDPHASVRRNVGELMLRRMRKTFTQAGLYSSVLEMKDFIGHLPGRLNRIMDGIANADFEVKVKAVDAKMVVEGFQKIANRITAGIILASLIIGASSLMQVPTNFHIFGYSALAILCFVGAAAGGIWLLISIFIQDQKFARKPSRGEG